MLTTIWHAHCNQPATESRRWFISAWRFVFSPTTLSRITIWACYSRTSATSMRHCANYRQLDACYQIVQKFLSNLVCFSVIMAATRRPVLISLKHCGSNLISSKHVNIFVSSKKRSASQKRGDIAFPCDELVQGFS